MTIATTTAQGRSPALPLMARRGALEVALLGVLYLAYSGSRLFADTSVADAGARARQLLHLEDGMGLAWERPLNRLFTEVDLLGLVGSYWYATAHYAVTAAVLVWLYRRGPDTYLPARRALVLATVAALVLYLALPTAPPRFLPSYDDVLGLHATAGW